MFPFFVGLFPAPVEVGVEKCRGDNDGEDEEDLDHLILFTKRFVSSSSILSLKIE